MQINWVPKKELNASRIQSLLEPSVESNHFTNGGPAVARLEETIRTKLAINEHKAVICVCNGTAALHALVSGIQLYHNKNLAWATQSFTFPASAQSALANAYIVDIDVKGGLDLELVDPKLVDGIIVTNIFGNVVDIDKYLAWADKHNKILLFDNAATPFTFYHNQNAVNYGLGGIISFHHTKPVGFGEGGAIIIDKKYEHCIRRCINFGIDNNTNERWCLWGSNYKMSDIQAVYIEAYLDTFEQLVKHHHKLYEHLLTRVKDTDIQLYPNFSDSTPFMSCFCLLAPSFNTEFIRRITDAGVQARKYYHPLIDTPVAMDMYNNIICIPCTIDMSTKDIDQIWSLL